MNEELNPLQLLVARLYLAGGYDNMKTTNDVKRIDEPLFTLLIETAAGLSGPYDLTAQLHNMKDVINALIEDLETL